MKHKRKILGTIGLWAGVAVFIWVTGFSISFRHKQPQVATKPQPAAPTQATQPGQPVAVATQPTQPKTAAAPTPAASQPQPAAASTNPTPATPQRGVSVPIPFTDKQVNLFTNL